MPLATARTFIPMGLGLTHTVMTSIPPDMEETLKIRKLHKLFTAPPAWIKPDATLAA